MWGASEVLLGGREERALRRVPAGGGGRLCIAGLVIYMSISICLEYVYIYTICTHVHVLLLLCLL